MMIKERIFEKIFHGEPSRNVRFSDIKVDLNPNDIIEIDREEPFYSENNSCEGSTHLIVYRERERTEQEKLEFQKRFAERLEKSKEKRYQQYLKLKEEFDPRNE